MSQLPPPTRTARPQQADDYDNGPFTFRPASKDGQRARLSLQGPSGSGKTWTGLSIAAGFAEGERFAVIDTERGAASLYIDDIPGAQFDTLPMRRYDPRDLIKALAAAAQAGYPVAMVDSLSHYWKEPTAPSTRSTRPPASTAGTSSPAGRTVASSRTT